MGAGLPPAERAAGSSPPPTPTSRSSRQLLLLLLLFRFSRLSRLSLAAGRPYLLAPLGLPSISSACATGCRSGAWGLPGSGLFVTSLSQSPGPSGVWLAGTPLPAEHLPPAEHPPDTPGGLGRPSHAEPAAEGLRVAGNSRAEWGPEGPAAWGTEAGGGRVQAGAAGLPGCCPGSLAGSPQAPRVIQAAGGSCHRAQAGATVCCAAVCWEKGGGGR